MVFDLHLPHLCVLIIVVLSVLLLIQSIVKGMNTLKSIIIFSINFIKKELSFWLMLPQICTCRYFYHDHDTIYTFVFLSTDWRWCNIILLKESVQKERKSHDLMYTFLFCVLVVIPSVWYITIVPSHFLYSYVLLILCITFVLYPL